MLVNPVNTKSVVITTRQKHQLSNVSLRLSLDGQNTENITEHRLLGLTVDNKFRWQAHIEHRCKRMSKDFFLSQLQHIITVFSFSTTTYHQHQYQKTLLQRSHKTSHRLCVSNVGRLWRSTLKNTELPTSKGRQINPS